MAEAARTLSMSERLHWNDFFLPWLVRLIFVAIGLLIGLYILGPQRARSGDAFIPTAYGAISMGVADFTVEGGSSFMLPIRLADTSSARAAGFNGVGPAAMGNTFLLYALSRETTRTANYNMDNIRVPLEVAMISEAGDVVAVQSVLPGNEGVAVPENHRWLLVARQGAFEAYGIGVDATLDPESVRKLNF